MVNDKEKKTPTKKTGKSGAISNGNGSDVVRDPLVNIGCRFKNGLNIRLKNGCIINLNGWDGNPLRVAYTRLNISLWEMIVSDGQYASYIEDGSIFLSKNGR